MSGKWLLRMVVSPLLAAAFSFQAAAAWPQALTQAKGAVLIEAASGRVLAEHRCHEPMPNASTTKIMTALLTLEQEELDESFVVDAAAIRTEGSSIGLLEGDQATLRTLAWGMLLASGNDAANAAAVRIDGSLEAFCGRMNRRAAELGMKDTHFCSPSGLDVGDHHTTAYDLALLTREALSNDDFAEMVRSKSAKLCYGNPPYHRWLTNHNRLLWQYEDCIGVKTGFTKAAGRCLVSAAERSGLTLIAVTLNCPDDFNVHRQLYEEAFSALEFLDVSDTLGSLSVAVTGAEQERGPVEPLWTPGAYLTAGERSHYQLSVRLEPFLYAPVRKGQPAGEITLTLEGVPLSVVPLIAAEERPARFPEYRSIIQQIKDFFEFPEQYRFPLSQGGPASASSTSQN